MQDRETKTYWSHVTGEALTGELKGKRLTMIPVVQTTWSQWIKDHPDTKVLKKEEAIRSSQYESYFKDPERIGIFRAQWLEDRMPGKELVYGVTRGPHALAVKEKKIDRAEFVRATLGEDAVIVVRGEDGGVRAFLPKFGEKELSFKKSGSPASYRDRETGSTWDFVSGRCLKGELEGSKLTELPVTPVFWFAWSGFYPNTAVID